MMLSVQRATAADAPALLAIYTPYVLHTAVSFEYEAPSEAEFRQRIENISAKYPYLKAVENGETVGYAYAACFKSRPAYSRSVETTIYLRSDVRGRGIGRALYEQLEKSLRQMGILNMNACIAVPGENDPYLTDASIRFHAAMGFTPVGVFHHSGYKLNRWYDMTWMEKAIGPHDEHPKPVNFGGWTL